MLVPDRFATSLRHLLVIYVIAERLGGATATRSRQRGRTMNSNPIALIVCESVLDPILEQLTTVLDEHSANFADPVAEALERLRSTAADTSVTISAAILETLGPDTTPAPLGSRWTCRSC